MSLCIIKTKSELLKQIEEWKKSRLSIGFVPTMGALHAGHLSLVDIAARKADKVVVSIFVNPAQFAPHEDLATYPRDLASDIQKLTPHQADLVYCPSEDDIYPEGQKDLIKAGKAADGLEGAFRPHFFDGVATVVSTLFDQVQPDIAVFGEKDYQQFQVISEMVTAQNHAVTLVPAPVIRDEYGLALSSRNAYLNESQLAIARQLNSILRHTAQSSDLQGAEQALLNAGFERVDYVAERWGRILAAAWIDTTRLIDNVPAK